MQYTMKGQTYELPENTPTSLVTMSQNQDEVRRVRWLAENSRNEELKQAARELMGAYDFARLRHPETRSLYSDELFNAIHRFLCQLVENKGYITKKFMEQWAENEKKLSMFQFEASYFGLVALGRKPTSKPEFLTDAEEARILKRVNEREALFIHRVQALRESIQK